MGVDVVVNVIRKTECLLCIDDHCITDYHDNRYNRIIFLFRF